MLVAAIYESLCDANTKIQILQKKNNARLSLLI